MRTDGLHGFSAWWFRLLVRLYPVDFREEMGDAIVETYLDRAGNARSSGKALPLARVWVIALADALRNGLGERLRPAVTWRRAGNWGRDMELVTRRLRKAPLFALAIAGTLTVGLGGFAVVYTAVDKILLEPMPYRDPEDLYFVWRDYTAYFDLDRGWLAGPDVAALAEAGGVIQDAVGLAQGELAFSIGTRSDPIQIPVIVTSPNLFEVLGVSPELGRGFDPEEVGPGRPPVIVLTNGLWNRLGSDPEIIGKEVTVQGSSYTVIGVMPPGFSFVRNASLGPAQEGDAFITFSSNLSEASPGSGSYAGLIRARHGTSVEVVTAAVSDVGRMLDERDHDSRGLQLYPAGLQSDLVAGVRPALIALGLAGGLLVVALMVNLSSLLLARTARRDREVAICRALGANGAAIVRAILFEGGVLGFAGGVLGALAGIQGTQLLVSLAPLDLPRRDAVNVDWTIGAAVVAVGLLTGLLAAAVPAAWAARTSLPSLLASATVRGAAGGSRLRRGMVVAQVALSLVLLATGGLVVRSFGQLLAADPGFVAGRMLTLSVPIADWLVADDAEAIRLQDRIETAMRAIPGVTGVSAANALPLGADGANQTTITIPESPGLTGDRDQDRPLVDFIGIRAGFVEVMGMRLLAGREFQQVPPNGNREALIDQHLAAQFFPTGNPLGATIPFDDSSLEIVGVVDQIRLYDIHQDDRPQLFIRAEDFVYRNLNFVLRTERDPETLVPDVRTAVRQIDPRIVLANVRTMDSIVDDALRQERTSAVLIAGFALGALLLAAMGLFGVVSGSLTRRRGELAVRMALGATRGRILWLVLSEGAWLVLLGLALGAPGVYLTGRAIQGALVGVSPSDSLTLAAVAIGLGIVTMSSCYLAARNVTAIEPSRLLNEEG